MVVSSAVEVCESDSTPLHFTQRPVRVEPAIVTTRSPSRHAFPEPCPTERPSRTLWTNCGLHAAQTHAPSNAITSSGAKDSEHSAHDIRPVSLGGAPGAGTGRTWP